MRAIRFDKLTPGPHLRPQQIATQAETPPRPPAAPAPATASSKPAGPTDA